MIAFLIQICAALKKSENFQIQSCTRDSEFSMRIDNHFEGTILTAQVESPDFLHISERSISRTELCAMQSVFISNILDISYESEYPIILSSQSLLMFNINNVWDVPLIQNYMHPAIKNYEKLTVGKYIVLYKNESLAIFTNYKDYPKFISEFYSEGPITSLCLLDYYIIISENSSLKLIEVEDYELGSLVIKDSLYPSHLNLTEFLITQMWTHKSFLFILDRNLGLCQMTVNPFNIIKIFDVYGTKLAGYESSILIDGKYLVDYNTGQIIFYNNTTSCDFLSLDSEFIYCASEDKINFMSRLLPVNISAVYRPIKGIFAKKSVLLIAFRDIVKVEKIQLSPVTIIGIVPGKVSDYEVKFKVWGIGDESEQGEFLLKVLYSLTDVILFIVSCLVSVFIIIGGGIFTYRYCSHHEEKIPIRQESVNPGTDGNPSGRVVARQESIIQGETSRNPFSGRSFLERTHSIT